MGRPMKLIIIEQANVEQHRDSRARVQFWRVDIFNFDHLHQEKCMGAQFK